MTSQLCYQDAVHPVADVSECCLRGSIIHNHYAVCLPEVLLGNASEPAHMETSTNIVFVL